MKPNPPRKKTAAEVEEERKKRDEAWWRKVIAYYLYKMYQAERERQEEKYRPKLLVEQLAGYFRERNQKTMEKLTQKKPGELSALELLIRMEAYQEEDSPFRSLLTHICESPNSEEKLSRAVDRVVEEAPQRILDRVQRNSIRRRRQSQAAVKGVEKEEAPQEEPIPEVDLEEERRLFYEMAFLKAVMSPQRFQQLFQTLTQQGRIPIQEPEDLPQIEEERMSYEDFVAARIALPKEREGKIGNFDELYSAAAYMLAAAEQKGKAEFDAKKAEIRAMEISGTKAFRLYAKQHPGSLVAAAQNTGMEATAADLAELDRALRARDNVLFSVRDALRSRSAGKSGAWHRMMNGLDRFVSVTDEPDKKDKEALVMNLAQYVLTEGDPRNPGFQREGGLLAATALRALLPEKDFQNFLMTANSQRGPEEQITREMLDARVSRPQAVPEREGPTNVLASN